MPQLLDADAGRLLIAQLEIADTFWQRFRGLQFRSELSVDSGLWIKPCSSLHTCFMRFAIDVVMLDKDMKVIDVRSAVRPWRCVFCKGETRSIIETRASAVSWTVGSTLRIQPD